MNVARPREVSCLALTFFYDYLAAHGHDRSILQRDLPYSPDELNNRLNWIDYQTFRAIENRVAELFSDNPDVFFDIGRSIGDTGGFGFIRVLIRTVVAPAQVYMQIPPLTRRFLFPFVHITFHRIGRNVLRASYVFDPRFEPSDGFFDTVRGILTGVPTMMGAEPAEVVMTRVSRHEARYEVRLAHRGSLLELPRAVARQAVGLARMRLRTARDAAAELEDTNRLLLEKVEALTRDETELKRRVRDLSIRNALAEASAGELELGRVGARAIGSISAELGDVACALLLAEGQPPGLVRLAAAALDDEDVRRLGRIGDPRGPTVRTMLAEGRILRDAGDDGRFDLFPMQIGDRVLGALAIDRVATAGFDLAFFRAMATQLAFAVDSALSYRMINDLRANLEVRVQDRTAQLETARAQLEQNVSHLEAADRFKTEFFANVTHEFKTPLALVMTPLEHMLDHDPRLEPDQRAALTRMLQSSLKLLRMIGDLLDLSKLEESCIKLTVAEHDLAEYVGCLVEEVRPLVEQKSIALVFEAIGADRAVWCDLARMERVFVNLLSNAAKFTPAGGRIEVSVRDRGAALEIEVRDDGEGFPEEAAARLFERFYQVEMGATRRHGGTGIGLALARELVELHGGTLEAAGRPGEGAAFKVTLRKGCEHFDPAALACFPGEAPADPGADRSDAPDWLADQGARDRLRLLDIHEATERQSASSDVASPATAQRQFTAVAVDDNPAILDLVRLALEPGIRVLTAPDGLAGFDAVVAAAPDLVITDLSMPGIDGLELTRRLRADPRTERVPIVMLTAREEVETQVRGLDAGCSAYLGKPFSPRVLLHTVHNLLHVEDKQAQRALDRGLESLKTVAAGLAHEINNPLNYINSSVIQLREDTGKVLEMLAASDGEVLDDKEARRRAKIAGRVRRMSETAAAGVVRIAKVVELMRSYARDGFAPTVAAYDLENAVHKVVALVVPALGRDRAVTVHFEGEIRLRCVAEEINQVISNLVQNAVEASETQVRVTGRREASGATLTVSDDGPGVPADIRARVFTPFFSTKGPGAGMGLGLAIVWQVVQKAGGTIEIGASAEGGAEFRVCFPEALLAGGDAVAA